LDSLYNLFKFIINFNIKMSQSFEGAQPQVVRDKHKYRGTKDGMLFPSIPEEEEGRIGLNIMYDKRVFRGNTHN
jgi:hypothetical protein